MKYIIIIQLMFINFFAFSQNYEAKKINFIDKTNIENLENYQIYSLDKNELYKLISNSTKKYNLLVSFGTWCSPCRKSLPALINFIKDNKDKINLYIINIEKDKSKNLLETKDFFSKIGYSTPTFMVSEKYGKGTRSKYKHFIKDIIGEKEFSDLYIGMFENILYGTNSNIIYKSTYLDKDEDTLENIKKIITDKK